jgi:hypothetical protein
VSRARTRDEKLFAAAVVRRSFELRGGEYREGFTFVYEGVLRDLGLEDRDVAAYLDSHLDEVDTAIGRKGG